ncbi:Pr6Pr family membrane protein [Cryobacterium sinapicolor]|uniref:Pr6Pr family membrane protein n=1 Tax=Cryobacterium sinapicolor TaxID=1259236 RepID=UPI001F542558|nr:Pr6Pr family membrane protein [Cryobacterium sinapicolor]
MTKLIAIVRLAAVTLGVVAIIATLADTATRATINPFNFFGFFTMQSNIIWLVVMAITGVGVLRGKKQSDLLPLTRGCATAYMILVGAIYNVLLAGQEGGVALEWANNVVHIILPIYAVLDWILFADRPPLAWKRLWVSLIYPMVWVVVVLIRGATDGWVPYPFLNSDTGYGSVFAYVIGIAVLTVVTAAVVWGLSRMQRVKLAPAKAMA